MHHFLLAAFLLLGHLLTAQSLMEKLGAVPTEFVFMLQADTLQITDQYLLRRAVSVAETKHDVDYGDNLAYGYGYGFAYESFHLEFAVKGLPLDHVSKDKNGLAYRLVFQGQEGQNLGIRYNNLYKVKKSNRGNIEDHYFYSINLKEMPLTILNHCRTIVFMAN
jgi:hypothetical protein